MGSIEEAVDGGGRVGAGHEGPYGLSSGIGDAIFLVAVIG